MKTMMGIPAMALLFACSGGMAMAAEAEYLQVGKKPVSPPVTNPSPPVINHGPTVSNGGGHTLSQSVAVAHGGGGSQPSHSFQMPSFSFGNWGGGNSERGGQGGTGELPGHGIFGNSSGKGLPLNPEYESGFRERYKEMMGSENEDEDVPGVRHSAGGIGGIGASHLSHDDEGEDAAAAQRAADIGTPPPPEDTSNRY